MLNSIKEKCDWPHHSFQINMITIKKKGDWIRGRIKVLFDCTIGQPGQESWLASPQISNKYFKQHKEKCDWIPGVHGYNLNINDCIQIVPFSRSRVQ